MQQRSSPQPDRIAIQLHPRAERALQRGHPWVYAEGIARERRPGRSGDLAVIFDRSDRFLAIGLYDPASPIRIRILHRGAPRTIDDEWMREVLNAAHARRAPLLAQGTTGYRIAHGENDGLPGLIVDRYGSQLVVKLYTAAWFPHLAGIIEVLEELLAPERIVLRLSRSVMAEAGTLHGRSDGEVLLGSSASGPALFLENGLLFEADPISGHKTGFFLDQRENRSRAEALARGARVLNVFSYSGAFSVYCARGGALEVISVDVSGPALAAAERNFAHNSHLPGVAAARHTTIQGDAFEVLERLGRARERFGLVILDPPAFSKARAQHEIALRSYGRLMRLGLHVLAPGGRLIVASCSSRIGAEELTELLQRTAHSAGRRLGPIERTGHALDHPIGFPEGEYLKCLFTIS